MKKFLFFFYVLFLVQIGLFAQQENRKPAPNPFVMIQEKNYGQAQVTIKQSQAIEQLMLLHIQMNQNSSGVEGFRIQVYSGTGAKARQEAQNVRARFLSSFPNEKITVEYKAPFWNVRVGYFRHKHESLLLLRKLRGNFPNSYAVRDASIKPELFD